MDTQLSNRYQSPTQSSALRKYLFQKKVSPVHYNEKLPNKHSYATATYNLNDSSVTPHKQGNSGARRKRFVRSLKKREVAWVPASCGGNGDNMGPSPGPQQSRSERFCYSDYPFNVLQHIRSLRPREVVIYMGYSYSAQATSTRHTTTTTTTIGHELEYSTNLLIAQDIFMFLSEEIYQYFPCLQVKFLRHNIDKKHWKSHHFIPDYLTSFDIQIALCDQQDKLYCELLYYGSKYEIGKGFLRERLKSFMNLSKVKAHLLHPILVQNQPPPRKYNIRHHCDGVSNNDDCVVDMSDVISFPPLHLYPLKERISIEFGPSDVLCSDAISIFDGRAFASHSTYRNGQEVKVAHTTNGWGGHEHYNVVGYVLGCYRYRCDEELENVILYIQPKYDNTEGSVYSTGMEHCYLMNDTSAEGSRNDCPGLSSLTTTEGLPPCLDLLFSTVPFVYPENSCYTLQQATTSRTSFFLDGIGDDAFSALGSGDVGVSHTLSTHHHSLYSLRERQSGKDRSRRTCMFSLRKALFNYLHELVWRVIDSATVFSMSLDNQCLLQQSYSEGLLDWILLQFPDNFSAAESLDEGVSDEAEAMLVQLSGLAVHRQVSVC